MSTRQWPAVYTDAWFEALARRNKQQAAMTATMLSEAMVHRLHYLYLCAVCGDGPARDYRCVDEDDFPTRLCDDCLAIQQGLHGGRFTLIDR